MPARKSRPVATIPALASETAPEASTAVEAAPQPLTAAWVAKQYVDTLADPELADLHEALAFGKKLEPTFNPHMPSLRSALSSAKTKKLGKPPLPRKRRRITSATKKRPADVAVSPKTLVASSRLTFEELLRVKGMIRDLGELQSLQQQAQTIGELAGKVGGLDKLQESLAALVKLRS